MIKKDLYSTYQQFENRDIWGLTDIWANDVWGNLAGVYYAIIITLQSLYKELTSIDIWGGDDVWHSDFWGTRDAKHTLENTLSLEYEQ